MVGLSGNSPGIHSGANAVGNAKCNGASGEADVTTPC